jgi:hypothetical protein
LEIAASFATITSLGLKEKGKKYRQNKFKVCKEDRSTSIYTDFGKLLS